MRVVEADSRLDERFLSGYKALVSLSPISSSILTSSRRVTSVVYSLWLRASERKVWTPHCSLGLLLPSFTCLSDICPSLGARRWYYSWRISRTASIGWISSSNFSNLTLLSEKKRHINSRLQAARMSEALPSALLDLVQFLRLSQDTVGLVKSATCLQYLILLLILH